MTCRSAYLCSSREGLAGLGHGGAMLGPKRGRWSDLAAFVHLGVRLKQGRRYKLR